MIKTLLLQIVCCFMFLFSSVLYAQETVKFAMVGLSHGHSPWFFEWGKEEGMELVSIYEPDKSIARSFQERYGLEEALLYTDLQRMLQETQPDGILVFGAIVDHLEAVKVAAPMGIHVMVEKPLATTLADAQKMAQLAKENSIHLLTDYETSWYPATEKVFRFFDEQQAAFGEIRKMVFHHGHEGPKEIGVGPEFLEWLTDPVKNGGGALVDFGCYGANIMTYLMHGERPLAVTAVTKTYKPEIYPEVDDEATIIVDYKSSQGIIQASWNWPFNRKDMEVYGERGYVITKDDEQLRYRVKGKEERQMKAAAAQLDVETNPFEYFREVIVGDRVPDAFSPYTLENNLRVMEILDAARKSAEQGERVVLQE
ncbi:gfo/Idh/MocA family oxidoreductase [Echinicola strongylocentroti]|uniref:Gfo/Idh/MocA family oxidoreductase n=1 Tax=Echinicola strongylocentroti TaxID=1795355 RepID=A0A2Z4IL18_9BACT|nr:Gfo/Idh/MocA family oxidoreductase [Echinicola strongylocentroti]AWW31429.1 gfo/Idh/MocA family oxidoreductase [Echinicola strongylocentroti]